MIYLFKKYWKHILVSLMVIFVFVGSYIYYDNENNITTVSKKKLSVTKKEVQNDIKTVSVDIKGAVVTPGVYELDEGKRITDVIALAGGLTDNAYTKNLNLSKKLTDEMYILIYTTKEVEDYIKSNKTTELKCVTTECVCPDKQNDACNIKDNSPINKIENGDNVNRKISINTATKEDLMTLSGIGEAKANSIIEYRNQNGLFNKIEDIINVSGISDNIFNKIKDNIVL